MASPAGETEIKLTMRRQLTTLQKHHIVAAYALIGRRNGAGCAVQSPLPERLPTSTQLLANYPNPFNPETWVPFELSQDTGVTVSICVRYRENGYGNCNWAW
ncbi:MAG: hypothetical protein QGI86_21955 [Candidatus Poribacteria bacterium]|nr:hypothetical protein [Candidatus Poribacteria bacterium]MDP6746108.1 hypothetical protein [Candidatus Poribacteria bacterium]MDP6999430.1 hypothetical protein [Candidatus Poribacteria bacterium]